MIVIDSEEVSPCRKCKHELEEKNICFKNCLRLSAWRLGQDFPSIGTEIKYNSIEEGKDKELLELCPECQKRKVKSHGLCHTCYAREERRNKKKNINYTKKRKEKTKMAQKSKEEIFPKRVNKPEVKEHIFTVNLSEYPKILECLEELSSDSLLPIYHILVNMIAKGLTKP